MKCFERRLHATFMGRKMAFVIECCEHDKGLTQFHSLEQVRGFLTRRRLHECAVRLCKNPKSQEKAHGKEASAELTLS